MPDLTPQTDLTTTKARSLLAHAVRSRDEELVELRKANLACSNLDAKVREQLRYAKLRPEHVAHVVGLLLSGCDVDGPTATVIEKLARDAVEAASR